MIDFISKNAPVIGLIFFVVVFCVVVIYVFCPKNKKQFQHSANIPFKDDEKN